MVTGQLLLSGILFLGGLGFSTDQIGTALLCVAAPLLFLQIWVYPKVQLKIANQQYRKSELQNQADRFALYILPSFVIILSLLFQPIESRNQCMHICCEYFAIIDWHDWYVVNKQEAAVECRDLNSRSRECAPSVWAERDDAISDYEQPNAMILEIRFLDVSLPLSQILIIENMHFKMLLPWKHQNRWTIVINCHKNIVVRQINYGKS